MQVRAQGKNKVGIKGTYHFHPHHADWDGAHHYKKYGLNFTFDKYLKERVRFPQTSVNDFIWFQTVSKVDIRWASLGRTF